MLLPLWLIARVSVFRACRRLMMLTFCVLRVRVIAPVFTRPRLVFCSVVMVVLMIVSISLLIRLSVMLPIGMRLLRALTLLILLVRCLLLLMRRLLFVRTFLLFVVLKVLLLRVMRITVVRRGCLRSCRLLRRNLRCLPILVPLMMRMSSLVLARFVLLVFPFMVLRNVIFMLRRFARLVLSMAVRRLFWLLVILFVLSVLPGRVRLPMLRVVSIGLFSSMMRMRLRVPLLVMSLMLVLLTFLLMIPFCRMLLIM